MGYLVSFVMPTFMDGPCWQAGSSKRSGKCSVGGRLSVSPRGVFAIPNPPGTCQRQPAAVPQLSTEMENNAGNETHDAFMASLEGGPYVYREDGAYIFLPYRDRPHQYYDISDCVCNTAEDVVGWIAHMTEKRWVTRKHIEQFTLLAIQQIGIRRR